MARWQVKGPRTLRIFSLVIREMLSQQRIARRPEPTAAMETLESVEAFHAEGAAAGSLLPIYHFNALATSQLLPPGGTLVDLGSGSGQYLLYLAQCRPDIQIIGIDLSETMVSLGNRTLEHAGLKGRVTLRLGDMTHFRHQIPQPVDVISSVFALHHLPTTEDLQRGLQEIASLREQSQCGVWLFDHARPCHPRTAEDFPAIFTPQASAAFCQDSWNSLLAAFSFAEMSALLEQTAPGAFHHVCSKLLRLYQVHWLERQPSQAHTGHTLWIHQALCPQVTKEFRQLRRILRAVTFLDEAA